MNYNEKKPTHRVVTTSTTPAWLMALGQAMMGNKVYHMAALWDRMTEEEIMGANEAAFAGKQWIQERPAAHEHLVYQRVRRARACAAGKPPIPQQGASGERKERERRRG